MCIGLLSCDLVNSIYINLADLKKALLEQEIKASVHCLILRYYHTAMKFLIPCVSLYIENF